MTGMGGRTESRERKGQSAFMSNLKTNNPNPPTHMTVFNFNYFHTPCTVSLEIELQCMNFRVCNSVHNSTA